MKIDIPKPENRRVVIIGGGFAGLTLAKSLIKAKLQVVLIDKNNYHAFPPLLYQVATADLEATAIAFPFRKIFRNKKNFFFRLAEVLNINPDNQSISTNIGDISYDYLIIATGSKTNFFNMEGLKIRSMPMKNINQAINLRHMILQNFEQALGMANQRKKKSIMNYVIAGGGPTGVELAGALGEIKKNVLPSEYPELESDLMQVNLIQAGDRILPMFSEKSSAKAQEFLEDLGVKVQLNSRVTDYFGDFIQTNNNEDLVAHTLIWTAGVTASPIQGIGESILKDSNRIEVDKFNEVKHYKNIFAIGDVSSIISEDIPRGLPMIAPVAIQQAQKLTKNLKRLIEGKKMLPFKYKDKGSMATIGKNKAVVEMGKFQMHGRIAWYIWMLVHLLSLVGFSKKINVFITWTVNYFSKDRGVQLILRRFDFHKLKEQRKEQIKIENEN